MLNLKASGCPNIVVGFDGWLIGGFRLGVPPIDPRLSARRAYEQGANLGSWASLPFLKPDHYEEGL